MDVKLVLSGNYSRAWVYLSSQGRLGGIIVLRIEESKHSVFVHSLLWSVLARSMNKNISVSNFLMKTEAGSTGHWRVELVAAIRSFITPAHNYPVTTRPTCLGINVINFWISAII